MAPGDIPVLPDDIGTSYLAEGAANIVYKISIRPGTPQESLLDSYGEGTPPPEEIDTGPQWLGAFDSKLSSFWSFQTCSGALF
jgi:hypothetical protein